MRDDIVIVSAARTPVGTFNGAFATLPAHDLGKVAIAEALKLAGVEGAQVSEVIMGQILTAGRARTRRARPRSPPAIRSKARPGASTNCADLACGRSRSAIRRSSTATAKSWWRAARNR